MTAFIVAGLVAVIALLIALDTRNAMIAHAAREAAEAALEDAIEHIWDDVIADVERQAREDREPWQRGGSEWNC